MAKLLPIVTRLQQECARLDNHAPGRSKVRAGTLAAELFTAIHADEPQFEEPTFRWGQRNGRTVVVSDMIIIEQPKEVTVLSDTGRETRHTVIELVDHNTLIVAPFDLNTIDAMSTGYRRSMAVILPTYTWRLVNNEWMAHSDVVIPYPNPEEVVIHRLDGITTKHKVLNRFDSFLLRVSQFPISQISADWVHEDERSHCTWHNHHVVVYQSGDKWRYNIYWKSGTIYRSKELNHRPIALTKAEQRLQQNS